MPYYVYRMTSTEGMALVKNLELMEQFDIFKLAKKYARDERAKLETLETLETAGNTIIKVMFAENQLLAEEQLLQHRDKPIVMEHEK